MRIPIILVSILLVAFGTGAARAHAFLDHANPAVGSTVQRAPQEITLSFTLNIEAAGSNVQVTDAGGARVDLGKPQISGSTMRAGLKALKPGAYRVRWHVLSADGHTSEGNFSFTVGGS
jgi:methionine-rich copper-binding protein CopC